MTRPDDRPAQTAAPEETDVLIIGGGPAGSLLACLLARRGIRTVLVEKQTNLERSFRGETLAAPSVTSLHKLGFGPALRAHGFLETTTVTTVTEGRPVLHVDYRRFRDQPLPIDIPQPALIRIFNDAAEGLPGYVYLSGWSFSSLMEEDGAVRGAELVRGRGSTAERTRVRARLVVGADGRFSKVRKASGLPADIEPMARDFLSFKLPRPPEWGQDAQLIVDHDRHLVVLPTFPDSLRIGHNLPKRGLATLRRAGFAAFRDGIAALSPALAPLVREHLLSWDDTSFLEIFTAEMEQWARDGLLLIGDASHTATPILGQGVNLAMQDAITLVPVLVAALDAGAGRQPVGAGELADFVAGRRAHKMHVTRFQRMQESQLAVSSPRGVRVRRLRYRLLNAFPGKYRIFDKVINAQHPVDPVDLSLAQAALSPGSRADGASTQAEVAP
ncbi:FAD-dependent monooxygenase [Streptomyces sp. DSM 42041]|uniref:FAD-dependent monooxygenase n=1 Tax=Streptomyces hazeniae TaxID=3075538 RepID=A0ABU2NN92_9ACTN|nr:FAD-dependent monooxygenase [Streptomyces sp. DSM 42041]MDT0378444.1 FAD-dependent monooxygenase [Streptomyces sp. DSM 42041]